MTSVRFCNCKKDKFTVLQRWKHHFQIWHGLPSIVQSSSVRTNGPKFTWLKFPRLPCLGCYAWSSTEVPATFDKYFWVKSSSSVDLGWLAAESHWQIHSEFHQAIKSMHQRGLTDGGHYEHRLWLTNCIFVATICCTSCSISIDWQHYEYCIVLRCKFLKCLVTFCWWFW